MQLKEFRVPRQNQDTERETTLHMLDREGLCLGQPLCCLLGNEPLPSLGLRLGLGAHDATSPLLPDLIELVVEVGLQNSGERRC